MTTTVPFVSNGAGQTNGNGQPCLSAEVSSRIRERLQAAGVSSCQRQHR